MAAPDNEPQHFGRIASMCRQLNEDAGLVVWCNSSFVAKDLKKYLEDRGIRVQLESADSILPCESKCILLYPHNVMECYSKWVRDSFVFGPLESDGSITVVNTSVPKESDASWVENYLQKLQFDNGTRLHFLPYQTPGAGGNLMADGEVCLIGANQIGPEMQKESFRAAFLPGNNDKTPWKEVRGSSDRIPSRLAHLDLYLSFTGCTRNPPDRQIVFLAECKFLGSSNQSILRSEVESLNEYLNQVAFNLEEMGFDVVRNPAPLLHNPENNASYLCAINNCLVEVTQLSRTVWLPSLTCEQESYAHYQQLQDVEKENDALWAELGFEVRIVEGNFHDLFDEIGALHCITNELMREPPDCALVNVDLLVYTNH